MASNNESLGMSVEYLICELSGLRSEHLAKRADQEFCQRMEPAVRRALEELPRVTSHVGGSSEVDFQTDAGTLSVKTNLKVQGAKVAPQNCGQPSALTYTNFFRRFYVDSELEAGVVTKQALKRRVQERTAEMMAIYVDNLFDCDFTLWAWMDPSPGYRIIREDELGAATWEQDRFSFTRTPDEWNESCTVKYQAPGISAPIAIGEFQIHNNRDNYKFRFNMGNLLVVIGG